MSAVAPKAGLFEAAKRGADVAVQRRVDPDCAGSERKGNTMGAFQILRPDIPSQAKLGIIGKAYRFGFVLEAHKRRHRAKDFLAAQTSCRQAFAKDRRLQIMAFR